MLYSHENRITLRVVCFFVFVLFLFFFGGGGLGFFYEHQRLPCYSKLSLVFTTRSIKLLSYTNSTHLLTLDYTLSDVCIMQSYRIPLMKFHPRLPLMFLLHYPNNPSGLIYTPF